MMGGWTDAESISKASGKPSVKPRGGRRQSDTAEPGSAVRHSPIHPTGFKSIFV